MSATNHTANYNLPQFIGSDKPAWLVDFNGAMADIDAAIYAAKSQADATDLVVTGHTSAIEALQTTESDQGTAIASLRTDVDGNTGSINTINSLIGNGTPTTSDKTLIGAINELDADKAEKIKTDQLVDGYLYRGEVTVSVTPDNDTVSSIFDKLSEAATAYMATQANNMFFQLKQVYVTSSGVFTMHGVHEVIHRAKNYDFTSQYIDLFASRNTGNTDITILSARMRHQNNTMIIASLDLSTLTWNAGSFLNNAVTDGSSNYIRFDMYEKLS